MAVYVDQLMNWGWRYGKSCHLIADSIPELITFAKLIGMQECWFQPKSSPHFDLTESKRKLAIKKGAIELDRSDYVAKLRQLRNGKES